MAERHYFQQKSTYELIAELSKPLDWTIYVGSGATFDRTGSSWRSLVSRLLSRSGVSGDVAEYWIDRFGLVGAATTIETIYRAKTHSDDEYVNVLRADLRQEIYGPRRTMQGRLLEQLALFGYCNARFGKSVVFVTPNYDEYLDNELWDQAKSFGIEPETNISIDGKNTDLPDSCLSEGAVSCVHIHGIVADPNVTSPSSRDKGTPVLGELEYASSHRRSADALVSLFSGRNLLIVGSTLTDGPLVNALIETREDYLQSKTLRYVIQPMQGQEWQVANPTQMEPVLHLNRTRRLALGLRNTRPEYFSQCGQLISEVQCALQSSNGNKMVRRNYGLRYNNRLDRWWREWSAHCVQNSEVQRIHHEWLADAIPAVRRILESRSDEALKIEVWVRWDPERERKLALWASSLGTWVAEDAMRLDSISTTSNYRSVSIFCAGSPRILHTDSDDDSNRWRSFFGFPIWKDGRESRRGPSFQLPVGVVTVASMWDGRRPTDGHQAGSIGEHNMKALAQARDTLEVFGRAIAAESISKGSTADASRRLHDHLDFGALKSASAGAI